MKYKLCSLSILAIFTLINLKPYAQTVERGSVVIDAYYGLPNLYKSAFRLIYNISGAELNLKFGGLNPIGIRGEYLVTDRLGVCLDVGFNSSTIRYEEWGNRTNPETGFSEPFLFYYKLFTYKIGVLIGPQFHFIRNEHLDFYGTALIGYANRRFGFETNDLGFINESIKIPIPIGFKVGFGVRYFFTNNLGVNLGLGIGQGGIVNGGLSLKF